LLPTSSIKLQGYFEIPICIILTLPKLKNPGMLRLLVTLALYHCVVITGFGQCGSELLLPTTGLERYNSYGEFMATDAGYLVISAYGSDTLERDNGIAFVYKLNAADRWERIAILAPSDPQESMYFGWGVAISGTSIAIHGRRYDSDGNRFEKIYVFERETQADWISGTESYQLVLHDGHSAFLDMDMKGDELFVSFIESTVHYINIYKKGSGIYIIQQQLVAPLDGSNGAGDFGFRISVAGNVLAVSAAQFANPTGTAGRVFVYQKTGAFWSTSPIAILEPSIHTEGINTGFALDVVATENAVVVHARFHPTSLGSYASSIYFYDKPETGWVSATETSKVVLDDQIFFDPKLAVSDDYAFIPAPDWASVKVFKKNSLSWSSVQEVGSIPSPVDGIHFGKRISIAGNHLVITGASTFYNEVGTGFFSDYHLPGGVWESATTPDQLISDKVYNGGTSEFGKSLAVSGKYLAVGAPGDSDQNFYSGAVYMFKQEGSGWIKMAKLLAPHGRVSDQFGHAVAMTDSILFASALLADSLRENGTFLFSIGKVFVYRLTENGWTYATQILAPVVKSNAYFGQHIAYANGYVAISEYYEGSSESDGRVHIYKENAAHQWIPIATLRPEEDIRGDFFGRSIAMNDSLIVIGTGNGEFDIRFNMKVFVYRKKGEWKDAVEDARLIPTTKTRNDLFGFSVSLHGNTIVAGAPIYPTPNFNSPDYMKGAAYVFERPPGGWSGTLHETAQLLPSDPVRHGAFGYSVVVTETEIFVGAPNSYLVHNVTNFLNNADTKSDKGKIYRFIKNGEQWVSTAQEDEQLISTGPEWIDGFGVAVEVVDRKVYVGVPLDDTEVGFQTGSVQIFSLQPELKLESPVCSQGGLVSLDASPAGGSWSGLGVASASGVFDPSTLEDGAYEVSYFYEGCLTTGFIEVVDNRIETLLKSENQLLKCPENDADLQWITTADPLQYTWYYSESESGNYTLLEHHVNQLVTANPGYYRAEIEYATCPVWETIFQVLNELPPVVSIEPVPVVCSPERITLTATPSEGIWSGGSYLTDSGLFDPALLENGNYEALYSVVTPAGCAYQKEVIVVVDVLPKPVIISSAGEVCYTNPVTLEVTDMPMFDQVSFVWYRDDGNPTPIGSQPGVTVTDAGNFFVEVTKHTCTRKSEPVEIVVTADTLFVPNIFTPDGDRFNPYFEIRSQGVNDFFISVFNRYGNTIYVTQDPFFKWDGAGFPSGVYYYYLRYKACDSRVVERKGSVHLLR